MAYTVGFHTLGCKVSQYETEAVAEEFERLGFIRGDFDGVCDVYVINTCTVTAESDRKSRQMIRRAAKQNPNACVLVMGCSSQRDPESVGKIEGVSYVIGTNGKMRLPAVALDLLRGHDPASHIAVSALDGAPFEDMRVEHAPRTRAYVKIEDGCECRCAYCAIPSARGPVRSKAPEAVIAEVSALVRGGCREVVLTGIETASYGVDLDGYRLIDLIEALDGTEGLERIRLGSLTPEVLRDDFIERLSRIRTLAPHFHLSVQSGCSRTLAEMRRRYNAAFALDAMRKLREKIPGVMFTCDMMVGFPGETAEDFAESLAFARCARFLDMHVFAYSPRSGTEAATRKDQVSGEEKRARSAEMIALGREIRAEILRGIAQSGGEYRVLFETERDGVSFGHTDSFIEVCAEGTGLGSRLALIEPIAFSEDILKCKIKRIYE